MFSGIVKIADIDDYINPAQNCIKGLFDDDVLKQNTSKDKENSEGNKIPEIEFKRKNRKVVVGKDKENKENQSSETVKIDVLMPTSINYKPRDQFTIMDNTNTTDSFKREETCSKQKTSKIKLTLNDCLACSGCVTTAETMLIEQHSIDEFILQCKDSNNFVVASISPQTVVSLAHSYGINSKQAFEVLAGALKKVGVQMIVDYSEAVKLVLELSYMEFKQRVIEGKQTLICSECPGWICYAEKKIGESIIPSLSKLKSPQQVIGKILKDCLPNYIKDKYIYFCCIMPCFDKKLESSRLENKLNDIKEVDNVLSSLELEELFIRTNTNFSDKFYLIDEVEVKVASISQILLNKEDIFLKSNVEQFFYGKYFTSNGYSSYFIDRLVIDYKDDFSTVEIKKLKNNDFKELTFKIKDRQLSIALVYGFRNIQKVIKMKQYDYIEMMSCPGGCLNGGAQYRSKNELISNREMLSEIESKINSNSIETINFIELIDKINIKDNGNLLYFNTEFKAIEDSLRKLLNW